MFGTPPNQRLQLPNRGAKIPKDYRATNGPRFAAETQAR